MVVPELGSPPCCPAPRSRRGSSSSRSSRAPSLWPLPALGPAPRRGLVSGVSPPRSLPDPSSPPNTGPSSPAPSPGPTLLHPSSQRGSACHTPRGADRRRWRSPASEADGAPGWGLLPPSEDSAVFGPGATARRHGAAVATATGAGGVTNAGRAGPPRGGGAAGGGVFTGVGRGQAWGRGLRCAGRPLPFALGGGRGLGLYQVPAREG